MFFPVRCDGGVDGARILVKDPFGISILVRWGEYSFPDVKLIPATAAGTQGQLPLVHVLQHGAYMSQIVPAARPGRLLIIAAHEIGVLIMVDIDRGIVVKIDRV